MRRRASGVDVKRRYGGVTGPAVRGRGGSCEQGASLRELFFEEQVRFSSGARLLQDTVEFRVDGKEIQVKRLNYSGQNQVQRGEPRIFP